jgi:transposase-like protein
MGGKTRPPYPAEYRATIMKLARAGRNPEELAKEFEASGQTIRNWLRQPFKACGVRFAHGVSPVWWWAGSPAGLPQRSHAHRSRAGPTPVLIISQGCLAVS